MDFFRSCATNVRSVDDVLQTRFSVYSVVEDHDLCRAALRDHRQRGVLCTFLESKLWIFGQENGESATDLGLEPEKYHLKESGILKDIVGKQEKNSLPGKRAFLDALEATITFALAREEVYRVDSWTWLFAPSENIGVIGGGVVLLRVHPRITVDGTLHIATTTNPTTLRHVDGSCEFEPAEILCAPSGKRARLIQRTTSGPRLIDGEEWRSQAMQLVTAEGIHIESDEPWVPISLCDSDDAEELMWPARLCFLIPSAQMVHGSTDSEDWQRWFEVAKAGPFRQPLAVAADWHNNAAARDKDSMRTVPFLDDSAAEGTSSLSFGMDRENGFATSPPFNQRSIEQQAALAGIYPTPPDGLVHVPVSQQPTSDGISTTMQIDSALGGDIVPIDDDSRMQRSGSEQTGYQPITDDLFGDMGEMDFGDNDVGDADFAYFDEPDDIDEIGENLPYEIDRSAEHGTVTTLENTRQEDDDDERTRLGAHANEGSEEDQDMPDVSKASDPREGLPVSEHMEIPSESTVPSPKRRMTVESGQEKPLSPFGIRERLLPPPIPASMTQNDSSKTGEPRRGSLFTPVSFNEGLNLGTKYSVNSRLAAAAYHSGISANDAPETTLPDWTHGTETPSIQHTSVPHGAHMQGSSSSSENGDASSVSDTSISDVEDAGKMPWEMNKRRKVAPEMPATSLVWDNANTEPEFVSPDSFTHTLEGLASRHYPGSNKLESLSLSAGMIHDSTKDVPTEMTSSIDELLDLSREDMVYIAQIISEQALSVASPLLSEPHLSTCWASDHSNTAAVAIKLLSDSILDKCLPNLDECLPSSLALIREPLRTTPHGKPLATASQAQQRQPQRQDSLNLGPDYFQLPPPYLRLQRGTELWEMLPPALNFWSALSLGPASGGKDVQVVALCPSSDDCVALTNTYLSDLGGVYESRKLGSWSKLPHYTELNKLEDYEHDLMLVKLEDEQSLTRALKAYEKAAVDLGKALAKIGHMKSSDTIVICMVNPFAHARASQYLCACFWMLCKAYRAHVPKAHRHEPHSDLILHLIPTGILSSPDELVVLDEEQLATMCVGVHDRCPPSSSSNLANLSSALPILAAPSVELAVPPPKRIAFQLHADAPSDLLHEGSILNLAYALSTDGQWMTASWIDSTGRYQHVWSSSLRGRSFADVAEEVWDKTLDILAAREITWRVFLVAAHHSITSSEVACWRTAVGAKPRMQPLLVTLLHIDKDPDLQLIPPPPSDHTSTNPSSGNAVLTPATTPQGATYTVSPDASGPNAPPTPAPSEPVTSAAENDPDAHLVNLEDESWGMLLSPSFTATEQNAHNQTIAEGILFKRGNIYAPDSSGHLQGLGVTLRWDIRVRSNGVVDDVPPKQAELTLREVLRMYRNLGVLARAKGLRDLDDSGREKEGRGLLPLHIAAALRGARALDGYLR